MDFGGYKCLQIRNFYENNPKQVFESEYIKVSDFSSGGTYFIFFRQQSLNKLREIGCEGVDWIHLAQDRDHWRAVVNTVMNLRVP
jgi:hypothetical protein